MVVTGDEFGDTEGVGRRNKLDGERRQAACARLRAPGRRSWRGRRRGSGSGAGSLVLGLLRLLAEPLLGADEEAAGDGVPRVLGLVGLADDEAEAGGVGLVELVRVVLRLEVHPQVRGGGDVGIGAGVIAGGGGRPSKGEVSGGGGAGAGAGGGGRGGAGGGGGRRGGLAGEAGGVLGGGH